MFILTPIQEEHGYVEACVDAMLNRMWAILGIDINEIRQWPVDRSKEPWWMNNPPTPAISVAEELAKLAEASGRPSLAIPAERVAGDIFYAITVRKRALIDGQFNRRALRSDAAKRAWDDLAAARVQRNRP